MYNQVDLGGTGMIPESVKIRMLLLGACECDVKLDKKNEVSSSTPEFFALHVD